MTYIEPEWQRGDRMKELNRILPRLSADSLRQLDDMATKAQQGKLADFDYVAVAKSLADLDQSDALAQLKPVPADLQKYDPGGLLYAAVMHLAPHDVEGHADAHRHYLDQLRRRRDRHDSMPTLPDEPRPRLRRRT